MKRSIKSLTAPACVFALSLCASCYDSPKAPTSSAPTVDSKPAENRLAEQTPSEATEPEPAVASAQPGASVETVANLVNDPSLEGAVLGEQFPPGWGRFNAVPKGTYRFEVVEGGRTGKRCCLIEGDGQYITMPANRVSIDSGKRYAGRGWVKLEGSAASAQIRILYFDAMRTYIGETRRGHVTPYGEWQRATVTDRIEEYPNARYLALAMSVMGKGKAEFDDLELLVFDADNLPSNFEDEYGRSVPREWRVLDRWQGHWESKTTYKAAEAFPRAGTTVGVMNAAKILDDRVLQLYFTSETGEREFLSLVAYDERSGAYRKWTFLSTGDAYEWVGQWDEATNRLTLELVSPATGVTGTSITRFVGNDTIETTTVVKNSAGVVTRDITDVMTCRAREAATDIPPAGEATTIQQSPEQKVLDHILGKWHQRLTFFKAEWTPKETQETGTASGTRILKGRFVETKSQLSDGSILLMLATYDAQRKCYRRWEFHSNGQVAEKIGKWDADAKCMTWSGSAGNGSTSTAIDRYVDADTLEANLVIKDRNGKVCLHVEAKTTRAK